MPARICKSILLISSLVLVLACQSKPKQEEESTIPAPSTEATPVENVTDKAMNFDVQGSDSGNVAGLKTVHFDYDQAKISATARKDLAGNANWIKKNPDTTVQIEGHCDERGSIEYNLALGERRAKAVKNYMVSLGIDGARLTIISYGKEKPLVSGDTEATYAKNRRANFVPMAQ